MSDWAPDLDNSGQPIAGTQTQGHDWAPDLDNNGQPIAAGDGVQPFDLNGLISRGQALGSMASGIGSAMPGIVPSPVQNIMDAPGNVEAGLSNVLPSAAELPQAAINAGQFLDRNANVPNSALSHIINAANQAAGAPQQPYMNAAETMRQNPALGFGGQSPAQLAQQYPGGATIGSMVGNLPWFLGASEIAALSKLPAWGRIAASALGGGALNSGIAALQEVGQETQTNDQVQPQQVGRVAAANFIPGFIFSGGLRALGEGVAAGPGAFRQPAGPIITPESHRLTMMTPPSHRLPLYGANPEPRLQGEVSFYVPKGKGFRRPIARTTLEDKADWYVPKGKGFRRPMARRTLEEEAPPTSEEPPIPAPTLAQVPKPRKPGMVPIKATPVPPSEIAEDHIEKILDPDKSYRAMRDVAARPATAEEKPLAEGLLCNKINMETAESKWRGGQAEFYRLTGVSPMKLRKSLDPKYALEMKKIHEASGTPHRLDMSVETTISTASKQEHFPDTHVFKATTLCGIARELGELEGEFLKAESTYKTFKTRNEAKIIKTFPANETISTTVNDKEMGPITGTVRYRWQPDYYIYKTPEIEQSVQAAFDERLAKSTPHAILNSATFRETMEQVLNQGKNVQIRGLFKSGALDWFNKLPTATKSKVIIAIGATASAYLGNQQGAEAAPPPGLVGKVVKDLYKNGWKEFMGYGVVVRTTKLDMTTDMHRAFASIDPQAQKFWYDRMSYVNAVDMANVGARVMTDAEKQLTAGMHPYQIRDSKSQIITLADGKTQRLEPDPLAGWTPIEKEKAGDIKWLNAQYKKRVGERLKELQTTGVKPGHFAIANRGARAVQIDAYDMGIDLKGAKPLGPDVGIVNMLTGQIMKALFWGNYRSMLFHVLEATMATMSKYPGATARVVNKMKPGSTYWKFALANSPHGFFQQLLESQPGIPLADKIDKALNGPIDEFIKKMAGKLALTGTKETQAKVGNVAYDILSAQGAERAKLGLNATVIAEELAKDYSHGGAEGYMKDWLNKAVEGIDPPADREMEFSKIGLECTIEKNMATGSLPDGPLKERGVFQRTKLFTLFVAYKRAKNQQSRFVASCLDDALAAFARGDHGGCCRALRAFFVANIMVYGVAGSAAVPPYVWSVLSNIERVTNHDRTDTVQRAKDILDEGQKHVLGGYQMSEAGLSGFALTDMPRGAVSGVVGELHFPPRSIDDAVNMAADVIMGLLPKITFSGTLNMKYTLETLYQGHTGHENFRQYEEGIANQMAALGAHKPLKLVERRLALNQAQGALKILAKVETPDEVKVRKEAERKSERNYPGNVRQTMWNLHHLKWKRYL